MKSVAISSSALPLTVRAGVLLLAGALFFGYAGYASAQNHLANNIPHPGTKQSIQAPSTDSSSANHSSNIGYKSDTSMSLSPAARAQMQNSLSSVKAALEGIQASVSSGSGSMQGTYGNTASSVATEKKDSDDRIDQYRTVIAELRSVVAKLAARIEELEKNR